MLVGSVTDVVDCSSAVEGGANTLAAIVAAFLLFLTDPPQQGSQYTRICITDSVVNLLVERFFVLDGHQRIFQCIFLFEVLALCPSSRHSYCRGLLSRIPKPELVGLIARARREEMA